MAPPPLPVSAGWGVIKEENLAFLIYDLTEIYIACTVHWGLELLPW
jgi:hypothetical protein